FRQSIYYRLGNAKDALFDLMDAVLTTRSISSFVELSLSPLFRRKWPSIYEALQDAHPSRQLLMEAYAKEIPP
ncbi:NF041680 family putative transposase, partial [Acaryochloris marina NIES-2412]